MLEMLRFAQHDTYVILNAVKDLLSHTGILRFAQHDTSVL
jgi:hypothetical protein